VIRLALFLGVVTLCLFVFCLVDLVQTPRDAVRNLPKIGWLLLIVFVPLAGSVAWLVGGRPGKRAGPRVTRFLGDRTGRAGAASPDDDEEFLRRLRERAEEQRRRAEEQRRRDGGDPGADES
jgi:hypothetical protein